MDIIMFTNVIIFNINNIIISQIRHGCCLRLRIRSYEVNALKHMALSAIGGFSVGKQGRTKQSPEE
jgi:hypothetical protein